VALVKITEESVRKQAGDRVFEQALAMAVKVTGLSAAGPLIEATVDGIPVSITIGGGGLDARCGCPAPAPCPHAVAVALAWVRTGDDEGDLAAGAAAAVADLRAEIAEELGGLAEEARRHEHGDEWHPDPADLEELLDEAELLLDEAPDAVRELADDVIEGIEQALDFGTCRGAGLTETLARAQDLHLDACLAGSPDPARLAERLFQGALDSDWDSFDEALPEYAEALGPAGMARYEELLAHATGPASKLDAMRASLARAQATYNS
jgi:hypothetical protein